MSKIVKIILENLRNSIFLLKFFLKKLIFRSFCWLLTKKGEIEVFWHFLPHFFNFRSIFGNFKTLNCVFLPKFSIVTVVAIVATIGSRLSHCRNNIFDDNMIKCTILSSLYNLPSDVFGAPKPKGDDPESLIPEPDPTPKSRTRTNADISQS